MSANNSFYIPSTRFISGLQQPIEEHDIKGVILDIWGVIHNGQTLFPHTVKTLEALQERDVKVCLLSNTPANAESTKISLERKGLPSELYNKIVTSGEVASTRMDRFITDYGNQCWFVSGRSNGRERECTYNHLDQLEFTEPDEAGFFIISNPCIDTKDQKSADALRRKMDVARARNLSMVCTNPDLKTDVGPNKQEFCSGTFAEYYENTLGGRVHYVGKPYTPVYRECLSFFWKQEVHYNADVLAVGDTPHTDIAGANAVGVFSVFNGAGLYREQVTDRRGLNKQKTLKFLSKNNAQPHYAMRELRY